jgi:hypothetical protein
VAVEGRGSSGGCEPQQLRFEEGQEVAVCCRSWGGDVPVVVAAAAARATEWHSWSRQQQHQRLEGLVLYQQRWRQRQRGSGGSSRQRWLGRGGQYYSSQALKAASMPLLQGAGRVGGCMRGTAVSSGQLPPVACRCGSQRSGNPQCCPLEVNHVARPLSVLLKQFTGAISACGQPAMYGEIYRPQLHQALHNIRRVVAVGQRVNKVCH